MKDKAQTEGDKKLTKSYAKNGRRMKLKKIKRQRQG
jgi:hypothetical protein